MASTKRTKAKPQSQFSAPDILGRSQNWIQKVSSIRLSNLRVGQHFTDVGQHLTNMLAENVSSVKDSDVANNISSPPTNSYSNTTAKNELFHPSFCKLLKTKHEGCSLIFVGGKSGLRIWRTLGLNHAECSTDLIYASNGSDLNCIDLCFYEKSGGEDSTTSSSSSAGPVVVYLLLATDKNNSNGGGGRRHMIRPLLISGDCSAHFSSVHFPQVTPLATLGDQSYEGTANSISCTNHFLLVSQKSTGTVQLLDRHTLRRVGAVPSLGPLRPVVLAASARWIAIQTSQESVGGTKSGQQGQQRHSTERRGSGGGGGVPDMGEAARQVVSGLYSLSQVVSWQVVSAAVQRKGKGGLQGQRYAERGDEEEGERKGEGVVGGGVLVLDLGQSVVEAPLEKEEDGELKGRENDRSGVNNSSTVEDVDVVVCTHFAAHSSELGFMAFSPTGLKLASADCLGQVILVHSLVPSGLLSSAHPVISPASIRDNWNGEAESEGIAASFSPQLLYKLVRGLSLSSIVDIGFAANESVVFGSTANGTVHIFDLDQLSATDSSQGHSHGSSLASYSSFKSGNSLTNGGYGSLEHTNNSFLLSPPSSTSQIPGTKTDHNSSTTLLTMAAGSVSEGAFHQYGIPSADVTQFLSLRRPDLRVLQGYSDIRVKLPLSETFYRQQQQLQQQGSSGESKRGAGASAGANGIGGNQEEDKEYQSHSVRGHDNDSSSASNGSAGSTSYYPHEVNLHSYSLLYGTGGHSLEGRGSYELLVGTSEGLLSRFHLTLSASSNQQTGSGGGGVLSSLLPYVNNQSCKELNRWDLCVCVSNTNSCNNSSNGHSNGSSQGQNQIQSQGDGESCEIGEGDYSAWLYAASDVDEPLVTPLWLCPQVKLFTVTSTGTGEVKTHHGNEKRVKSSDKKSDSESDRNLQTDTVGTSLQEAWINEAEGIEEEVSFSKKKKKKGKQQQQQQFMASEGETVSPPPQVPHCASSLEDRSTGREYVSRSLLFPERQVSSFLNISRPSTFVYSSEGGGSGESSLRLDTGVMLEQYIQSALGDSFADAHRGATPIAISMIKHSKPPEDISAWQMDDDWGADEGGEGQMR